MFLMCTGPPLSPHPQLHVINATKLQVSWNEPFTWDPFPIIDYTVTLYNTSEVDREIHTNTVVTERSQLMTIDQEMTTCSLLRIEVSARNQIGTSKRANVSGGFPVGEFSVLKYESVYNQLFERAYSSNYPVEPNEKTSIPDRRWEGYIASQDWLAHPP